MEKQLLPRDTLCPFCKAKPASTERGIFPFCSDRCKTNDLAAWATEKYRVPAGQIEEPPLPAEEPSEGAPDDE